MWITHSVSHCSPTMQWTPAENWITHIHRRCYTEYFYVIVFLFTVFRHLQIAYYILFPLTPIFQLLWFSLTCKFWHTLFAFTYVWFTMNHHISAFYASHELQKRKMHPYCNKNVLLHYYMLVKFIYACYCIIRSHGY